VVRQTGRSGIFMFAEHPEWKKSILNMVQYKIYDATEIALYRQAQGSNSVLSLHTKHFRTS
jgi:hypothetical protein